MRFCRHKKTRRTGRVFQSRTRLVFSFVNNLVGSNPWHHRPQLLTNLFDWVGGIVATVRSHGWVVGSTFGNKHLGVFTALDALEGVAHGFTRLLVDDLRAGYVLTVLGVVGDTVVHVGNTAFEHQVNNQLELVQALEVSHFRRVTGFGQNFETGLDQLDRTTTENRLLAEQVGFGLVLEGGFDDAGTAAANATGVGQGNIFGIAGSVLVNRNQVRNATAAHKFGTHCVARRLGGNHNYVQIGTRHYL